MTHFFNNTNQHIRSQMWLLLINNFFRCAGSYETLQYLMITSVRIFYQRVQLSVGKGAGAALSELYIGLRVKNTIFPEILYCFLTFLSLFSAFKYYWTISDLRKIPSAEKSCRTTSHNNGRM